MDITCGIPTSSDAPPKGAPIGHIWYNSTKGQFYYKDTDTRWVATDHEDHVVDVIVEDTHEEAYNRAMSIL